MTTPIAVKHETKTIKRGYKFRIWPTDEQKEIFEQWFGCCRFVYNSALRIKKEAYARGIKSPSHVDLSKELTDAEKAVIREAFETCGLKL